MAGLGNYKKKRDFGQTPEPKGAEKKRPSLSFVIQKHKARALHYDFRLEVGGVLKSWAIPKGPTTNPDEKRLARMVEDHPLDYQNFEGIIPEGNYGAGTVMVWDKGRYYLENEMDPKNIEKYISQGIKKGHFKLLLDGRKLKGTFSLARLKDPENWLFLKNKEDENLGKLDENSAVTGRTLEEIKEGASKKGEFWAGKTEKVNIGELPKGDFPYQIKPMMATLVDKPFTDPNWLFEVKWDGYRTICEIKDGKVNLYSRNLKSFNLLFPEIVNAFKSFSEDAVFDGEIVSLDKKGKPDFQDLQNYRTLGKGRLVYYIFDVLYYKDRDFTVLPLTERKEILRKILPVLPNVRYSEDFDKDGEAFFKIIKEQNIEGMIGKKKDSRYEIEKRSANWVKVKSKLSQEAIIIGFTEPKGSRQYFGSLLLGLYEGKKIRYIGHTGTGFDEKRLKDLYERLIKIKITEPDLKDIPKTNTPPTWVRPELVCEVEFQEWTREGSLRQPVFKGLLEDKDPKNVKKEEMKKEETVVNESKNEKEIVSKGNKLKLSNLNKIFWPDEKITKGDLLEYYSKISKFITPHLKDRPETLKRYPNGINGSRFYHKDIGGITPSWVEIYRDYAESEDKFIDYMLVNDKLSLLYMVNLGAIEMHPWTSKAETPNNPDLIVIDLDPLEIEFKYVVKTALALKKVLDELGIVGYPKTSGASGMHIYIPLQAKYDFETARHFAEVIANLTHRKAPEYTSVLRLSEKRKGKVYVDFLQNAKGMTVASPYSVRPEKGATVSTPLMWEEINEKLDPKNFTIFNVPERVEKIGDLFKGVLGKGVDIEVVMRRI